MKRFSCGSLVLIASLTACASSPSTPAPAAAPQAAAGGEAHGEHHPNFSPTVAAFHEVLRPLWHSDPGEARDGRTCEQSATLNTRAQAIVNAPDEGPDGARWRLAAADLAAANTALVAACAATPRASIAARLEAVHTAFHHLIESAGEHH